MYIVSTFENTIKIETAITAIEMKGVPKEKILAVPLDKQEDNTMLFDTIHRSDGTSMFDMPIIVAATCALFGLIYGFVLAWGPILWALIGTGLGFFGGLGVKLLLTKKRSKRQKKETAEVVLIIECEENQLQMIQDTLWAKGSLGIAKLNLSF